MSHKYYGIQKQEEDNLYVIPFLSTKTQRLRFLNDEFVGYGKRNEFLLHKKPGLTIMRVSDNFINRGLREASSSQNLMNEFLNQLVYKSQENLNKKTLQIKQVTITTNSSIRIKVNSF
uniref:Uncharacterized protein n=1 Tax=Eustigmatophyceae sp. Chic 10/23 P-6w TaxID=1446905 RepID=A0A451FMK3_9STRA|nr:hypothetical protein Ycf95 [Eustigmatophyceae sp. Chic 10/23 P-6w]QAA11638.1 hypothetical protein Ycf95 [Eustigmatophyceae sp. Chic 10/23 P-6w]